MKSSIMDNSVEELVMENKNNTQLTTQQKSSLTIKICWYFYRFILSRRYKTIIIGGELLTTGCGKLILPNHQSHIDPQIMAIETFNYGGVVPVVAERFFKIPVIRYFLKAWGAIGVSEIKPGNRDITFIERMTEQVKESLREGKNVIIYPSGQLTDQGIEKIYNKQGAFALVSNLPEDVQVLGVRISGLWGSIWSKAWDGKQPHFLLTYVKAIFILFANLIIFAPKRTVHLEFVDITENAIKYSKTDRKTFNLFLESFYNKNGWEEANYIKHFFFLPKSTRKYPANLKTNPF